MQRFSARNNNIPRTAIIAGLAILAAQAPAFAQQAPPAPVPTPSPAVTPPAVVPTIPLATTRVLPSLTPAQAGQLAAMLATAGIDQGLRYIPGEPMKAVDEAALINATLDHARAVHAGRLDASDFQADWGMRPLAYDPLPAFTTAVKADRLAAWIASLPPPYTGYDGLKGGLATYRMIDALGGWKPLEAGPDLGPGAKGARVTALRERLAVEDKMVVVTGDLFDAELQAAVQRAQRRYGLNPTGVLAAQTRAALNVPAADRVRQIMANMERWRWLPRDLPKKRIQVNIAAAVVTVFDGDVPVMSMRGVTGKPGGGETPMLQSIIHSVVINPPWNVPAGIAARELFPKGSAYLARNGFKVIGEGANRRLQQAAGTQSALGRFKFDFDNPYAVYLHDTPSRSKFASFDRLASHGCIRLEKPAALAELLLRADPKWTPEAIQATVDAGKTVRVKLPEPVAVYLFYWTAFASANGTMNFRADPYQWDAVLAAKIEKRSATQQALAAR